MERLDEHPAGRSVCLILKSGRREAGSPEPSAPPLDHTMTRRWALLSRFGEGDQPGVTSPDGEQEDSSQSPLREYRQG